MSWFLINVAAKTLCKEAYDCIKRARYQLQEKRCEGSIELESRAVVALDSETALE